MRQPHFLNSLKWAYTANWGEKAFSAFFTFILAGILGPRDFGAVSIAVIYIAFLQMFLDQGLAAALIQRKNLEDKHLDAVFWMDIALSILLIVISVALSTRWAAMNHAPEIGKVISVLSVCILIEALSVVQTALLRRQMDFKSISIRANASVLIGGVVGIALAFAGFRVWSLVAQQIVRDFSALVLLWRLSPWRPRFQFSWKHLNELLGFSIPNFGSQVGVYLGGYADSLILGVMFGPVAVGLYRVADRIVNSVVAMTTASIQAVSFPEFSKVQDRPEEIRKTAATCIRLGATVTVPVLAGVASVSAALMATLGGKWLPATDCLKVLCCFGIASAFACFTGPLLQALGRPHHHAILEWTRMAIAVALLVGASVLIRHRSVDWQIMGIAIARFITMFLIVMPVFVYILMRLSRISVRELVSASAPSVLSGISIVIVLLLVHATGVLSTTKPIFQLAGETIVGGAAGISVLLALDRQLRDWVIRSSQRTFRAATMSAKA